MEMRKKDEELRRKDEELRRKDDELRRKDEELRREKEEIRNGKDEVKEMKKVVKQAQEENDLIFETFNGHLKKVAEAGGGREMAEAVGEVVEDLRREYRGVKREVAELRWEVGVGARRERR